MMDELGTTADELGTNGLGTNELGANDSDFDSGVDDDMMAACIKGDVNRMAELIDGTYDLGFLLYVAVSDDVLPSVEWLLTMGADVTENDSFCLTIAKSAEMIRVLLAAGANVQCHGNAPILRAALYDDYDSLDVLIRADATVTSDAWDVAVIHGHDDCVRRMLESGASVDVAWAKEYCEQNELWDVWDVLHAN